MAKKSSRKKTAKKKSVETLTHDEAKRSNIPTAELETVMEDKEAYSIEVAIERRNPDLDPQLVWRGKDTKNWSDLVVNTPPLFIQEKVHPKVLIDDLKRRTEEQEATGAKEQLDLFADFNGLPDPSAKTEFYQHESNWTNRMILGDSLQVMASLAEREGLRGKVQCIYFDPPYGIKFNSNFQWSTTSRTVSDGKTDHITREAEQVKAFRDTWQDGIHTYLGYLRERLTVARDMLADSGAIFVQIGDENVHLVRSVMDEIFGSDNLIAFITLTKTSSATSDHLPGVADYVLFYAKKAESLKFRPLYREKVAGGEGGDAYRFLQLPDGKRISASRATPDELSLGRAFRLSDLRSPKPPGDFPVVFQGKSFKPRKGFWKTGEIGFELLKKADRISASASTLNYVRFVSDYPAIRIHNVWTDLSSSVGGDKVYVVQTGTRIVERCMLSVTDPGDLVLDPTCGSGTTATVAEQWGRRWITIDTSRVALALARSRIMGARYPFYLLSDSQDGQEKEAGLTRTEPSQTPTHGRLRQGFVYERVPHITLKSIANNTEVDVIYHDFQQKLEPLREKLNAALDQSWEEWEIPREPGERWEADAAAAHAEVMKLREELASTLEVLNSVELSQHAERVRDLIASQAAKPLSTINEMTGGKFDFDLLPDEPRDPWPAEAKKLHAQWWKLRIERQKEIDASIAAKADFEYLYDKPYEDKAKVRVAGPFTVESLSPHRTLGVDENDELIEPDQNPKRDRGDSEADFATMILENLKTAGVQQAHKEDRITFTSITPWPGEYVAATGIYVESDSEDAPEKKSAIFIGPEFGTVARADLVAAAREAADAGFDVLVACAFNYDAHSAEFDKLGKVPVLKARMNADLHMADELKNTGKGNLFVIFGEPDIDITPAKGDDAKLDQIQVKINGVDVFHPQTGEVRSDGADGIACWFIDTNYNEESFFVRHAYFLGAGDPYKSLKTTLKAEINAEAWATLNSDTSRPFDKPKTGRIAVKVINHLGDEVMKVFKIT
ncbi:DNA methylase N-4/N-6 domain protein [Rhodopirellula baltica SH28]|uniref:DNA methylase N-4/N-6 domain protein n=2 Tax=Rhodopirellula baltica TaxID=265606 RepID=K5D3A1_RHOBT|nr:DNA methylase N-4/N-6 domain protein [Rhodopirellula baltica SH28]